MIGTENFDSVLIKDIDHYSRYPEMLPFIGGNWEKGKKVMLIGESHYLPFEEIKTYCDYDFQNEWYSGTSQYLDEGHKSYLNTRKNVEGVSEGRRNATLLIYSNLQNAIKKIPNFLNKEVVFDEFVFLNYFQKPAAVKEEVGENRSIQSTLKDIEFAHNNLKKICDILRPNLVIFISSKAFDQFQSIESGAKEFNDYRIDFVPHAGKQWWNKTSVRYGNRTGKDKFIDLLKEHYSIQV